MENTAKMKKKQHTNLLEPGHSLAALVSSGTFVHCSSNLYTFIKNSKQPPPHCNSWQNLRKTPPSPHPTLPPLDSQPNHPQTRNQPQNFSRGRPSISKTTFSPTLRSLSSCFSSSFGSSSLSFFLFLKKHPSLFKQTSPQTNQNKIGENPGLDFSKFIF